ncbi:GNAT family N-acetyltransferase [Maribacter sp. 2308TA10-17]|uniref:GNAT family N-acetyltransferase n=1 Tax=Maribacter sp. 2308TA10-17 TaxID=3386276 RepID=UPI0039BC96CD
MLNIIVKTFDELTANELYDLLQLRSEIFVVEQDCVYQDLDGKDQKALHVLGIKNDKIVAYTRIFKAGDYLAQASIGRVLVKKHEREHGYGVDIMKASIKAVEENFSETSIALSAQTYLKRFYNSLGFVEKGGEYLEDGIPHVMMVRG